MKTQVRKHAEWFQQRKMPQAREPEGYEIDDADPSAAMFAATRRRLTFWYTGILATLLLLSGALLYFSMQAALISPVDGKLSTNAHLLATYWEETGMQPCALHRRTNQQPSNIAPYIACFDEDGTYVGANPLALPLSSFDSSTLAQAALASQKGNKTDTINGGNGLSSIRRYALVVRSPANSQVILGVVQVGLQIGESLNALGTLVTLLLIVGTFTLCGSVIGGLYLSHRALVPTRLALTRQQAFTTDASHELRTPLTLMRADAEALLRARHRMDPDDVFLLENIVSEAAHMSQLVTNLLILARLDAGAVDLKQEELDLSAIAETIARRSQAYAQDKQITLCLEAEAGAWMLGDHALLEQVMLILVDNAMKYNHPDGTVTVRITHADKQVQARVSDTGVGIAANDLPHLGKRFYRVDKARSREAGGAGLGLAIARNIVSAHEGTLRIESTLGQGTVVTLQFPFFDAATDDASS